MKKELKLLQTLTAHICHELAGSIGTIDNCLSLMDTKDLSIKKQAELLVKEESSNLVRKIKYFRECYGISTDKEMSAVYLSKLFKDLFVNSDVQPSIHFEERILCLNAMLAKVVLCLVTISRECIKTGKIDLFFGRNNIIKIVVSGIGLKLKKDNFWHTEESAKIPITVANICQHYIDMMCDLIGYKITVRRKESLIEYTLVKSQLNI